MIDSYLSYNLKQYLCIEVVLVPFFALFDELIILCLNKNLMQYTFVTLINHASLMVMHIGLKVSVL